MPQIKRDEGRIEKWILRRAFDDEDQPYLPKVLCVYIYICVCVFANLIGQTNIYTFIFMQHILYRQKEQFSDGVGYSWIDGLKAHAAKHVLNPTCFMTVRWSLLLS